jgi:hypothetical protein
MILGYEHLRRHYQSATIDPDHGADDGHMDELRNDWLFGKVFEHESIERHLRSASQGLVVPLVEPSGESLVVDYYVTMLSVEQ